MVDAGCGVVQVGVSPTAGRAFRAVNEVRGTVRGAPTTSPRQPIQNNSTFRIRFMGSQEGKTHKQRCEAKLNQCKALGNKLTFWMRVWRHARLSTSSPNRFGLLPIDV